MSGSQEQVTPRYGWFGDDFTGATDTLANLAERGFRALLFLDIPSPAMLAAAGPLDAVGIAGATRALAPAEMAPILDEAGRFFAEIGVRLMHYKCCSTFDSAPHVGSIGAAVAALRPHFPNPLLPIVGGQPNLGRYCLFGQLFAAAGTGGEIHRIDRHPTMSRHPVTPMGEGDLRRHFAAQGLVAVDLVDYRALDSQTGTQLRSPGGAGAAQAVLFDVSRAGDLPAIARSFETRLSDGPMLAVGPSSVAQVAAEFGWGTSGIGEPSRAIARPAGPVLALAGSLSPVTRAQIGAATGFHRIAVDPRRLIGDPDHTEALRRQTLARLAEGNTLLVTTQPEGEPDEPRAVAAATARLLRDIMGKARVGRLLVAGGDTSTLAIHALDIWGLSYRAEMVPGAPLCRAHSHAPALDGLEIVLKGGQMGPPDFFTLASR